MGAPRSSRSPRYSQEQMEAILQRAIQKQSRAEEGISHEELLEAAEEVGIPREDVESAVAEVEAESRPRLPDPQEIEATKAAAAMRQARAYRLFVATALWFAVSGVLFTIGRHTGHHGLFVFSAIWGIALLARASNMLFPKPERLRKETKRQRRERERRQRAEESLHVFERKLTIGTEAIGHLIDRARGTAPPAQGWRPAQQASDAGKTSATGTTGASTPGATPVTRAPTVAAPASPMAPAAPEPAKSRIDAGTFERFIAARARVGGPAEELDALDDEVEDDARTRSVRR